MPLTYDEATYTELYSAGYRRATFYDRGSARYARRVERLPEQAVGSQFDVVVVGCGFGWLCEHLIDLGTFGTVVGIDPSPHVQANKGTDARADVTIVDATVGVDDVTQALTDAGLPTSYDVVIDEDAASSHSDAELPAFFDGLEALGNLVVHFLTPAMPQRRQNPSLNWKATSDWQAMRPAHIWRDARWFGD